MEIAVFPGRQRGLAPCRWQTLGTPPWAVKSIINAMQEIGFEESTRNFKHYDSQYFVEFPPGPLTIGAEAVEEIIKNSVYIETVYGVGYRLAEV